MNAAEAAALIAVALLLVFFLQLILAKAEKRKIAILNADGMRIQVDAEIANTTATKTKGLMGRQSLGENEGMLFIFEKSGVYPFWMLNTTIPLDAVFFSENGSVVDVIGMEPCGLNISRCRLYSPKSPSRYVLEVNRGFAADNRIRPGNSSLDIKSIG